MLNLTIARDRISPRVREIKGRKVIVESELSAQDEICARGHVVAVQMPEKLLTQ